MRLRRRIWADEEPAGAEPSSIGDRLIGQVEEGDDAVSDRADRDHDEDRDQGRHQPVFDGGDPLFVGYDGAQALRLLHGLNASRRAVTGALKA